MKDKKRSQQEQLPTKRKWWKGWLFKKEVDPLNILLALTAVISLGWVYWQNMLIISAQRAWVGPVEFQAQIVAGARMQVNAVLTNSGQTPARAVRIRGTIRALLPNQQPDLNDFKASENQSYALILPNQRVNMPFRSDGPVAQEAIEILLKGEGVVWLYGVIDYEDVYGDSHVTKVCVTVNPDFKGVRWCNQHNEAD